jgi:hypothetical protein
MLIILLRDGVLGNLLEFCSKSDGATRKKIPGCIFAEKLV